MIPIIQVVAILLFSGSCYSFPNPQNPCEVLKLPLCKLKSDFAAKNGITTKAPVAAPRRPLPPIRPPALSTRTKGTETEPKTSEPLTLVTPRPRAQRVRPPSLFDRNRDNDDANDSCRGLRFCVLSKNVPKGQRRRPEISTTPRPTVAPFVDTSSSSESLISAVLNGHLETARQLIKDGSDPNGADQHGNTVLHIAAQNGRADIVDELLLAGAEVNVGNNHKNVPLHLAAQNGFTSVAEKLLRAKKIDVNFRDLHANTPLHLAAQNGQIGVVKLLIERPEIDLDRKNTHGQVPLHLSAQNGHLELSRVLVKAGSKLDVADLQGNTPLHTAYHTTHQNIARMLIDNGANPEKRNLSGLKPSALG